MIDDTISDRTTGGKLPPLPDPERHIINPSLMRATEAWAYTADQMHAYALAAVEGARPKWTTEPPTEIGMYWTRSRNHSQQIDPIWRASTGDSMRGAYTVKSWTTVGIEWSDSPLPEPLEPKP